jgi:single-strand DNA-binding protein
VHQVNPIGTLTRDVESRDSGDTEITKLRVAVDRVGREGADYVDVTPFGRLAEVCAEYLHRGSRVGVTGRLSHREWRDVDGVRREPLEVVATGVDFLVAASRRGAGRQRRVRDRVLTSRGRWRTPHPPAAPPGTRARGRSPAPADPVN